MPHFDRYDVCEAYWLLECNYNVGGILIERPSCKRRMQSVGWQLHRTGFKPGINVQNEILTENGQAIYDQFVERYLQ